MGLTVAVVGRTIHLLSPESPLGLALVGRRPGARLSVPLPTGNVSVEVLEVG